MFIDQRYADYAWQILIRVWPGYGPLYIYDQLKVNCETIISVNSGPASAEGPGVILTLNTYDTYDSNEEVMQKSLF